jgi:hypothetical protein
VCARVLLLAAFGLLVGSPAARALMPGDEAPDFTLTALGGQSLSLSDYRGQVVLLALVGYD